MSNQQLGVDRPDEWIGALVTLNSYVTGEGEPYRPTAVMWLETESGLVIDTELVEPEQALARAAGLFQLATRAPKAGEPRVPKRLRVSDEALASALRGSVGDVELVVAPTPEIDDVVESMMAYMRERASDAPDGDDEDDGWTFLGPDTDPADVAAMFAAAARLFKAAPWDLIPSDVSLAVSCDVLGIEAGAMVVVGQMGQSHGFSLFSTFERALEFYDAVEAHERGERIPLPPHMMFSFDDRDEVRASLVEEIERHAWPVAGEKAYPMPLMVDPDRVARGLTRVEIVGVTAIMTALAALAETEPQELAGAWDDDEDATAIAWNMTVPTTMGDVNVELQAPVDAPHDHDHEAMATVETLLDEDGKLDPEVLGDYVHALMHELEAVPEIAEIHFRCAEVLILEAAKSFGLPITQLTAPVLRDLMFRVLPSGVALEPGLAEPVVDAAQLLMAYADEALGIETAVQCRVMLSMPGLVAELEEAFASRTKKPAAKKPAAKMKPAAKKSAAKKKPAAKKKTAVRTASAKKSGKAPAKKPAATKRAKPSKTRKR